MTLLSNSAPAWICSYLCGGWLTQGDVVIGGEAVLDVSGEEAALACGGITNHDDLEEGFPHGHALSTHHRSIIPSQFIIGMTNNLLLSGHSAQVLTLAFNHSTTLLASAGVDRTIMLWSQQDGFDNTAVLKGHSNAVTSLTWTFSERLLTAGADKSVVNWDVEQQKPVRKYRSHKCIIHDVAAPNKTLDIFASVADDGLIKVWEPRSKQQIKTIATKYPLTSISFSLHGDRIFAGGIDNQIKVISVGEGRVQEAIQGHQDTISSLQISFDGSYLMSNSFDETIRIWDVRPATAAGKRLKKTLSGHVQGNEKSLIRGGWSIDGLYVCSGSTDKCVYIWDTTTKKIVQRLGGHHGTVNQAAMGKGNWLASCSNDKTLIVSQLPEILL